MKKSIILLVLIFVILTLLPSHQVFAQEGAWGEVVDGDGNILYDNMSDQGVVTQAADWMPSISLPVVGTVSVPAEYHSYVTESGNTVLMPTASTLFFMAANADESGFSSAASTMGTSGLSAVNSDNGNVVGFASLGAFFGALAGNQDIGLPTTMNATDFFNQVVSGQTNIWSLNPAGLGNFLTSLSSPSLKDGNLYTYMLLYTPGQCGSTPAGCSASQLTLLPPVAPTPPPPPTSVPPQSPPESACPDPSVKPGVITANASEVAPPYPLVVGQDPDRRGVDVVFSASVAPTIYTYYTAVPIYSQEECTILPCSHRRVIIGYTCIKHVISYPECIASASASISLSQESREWILNELSIRYPEAYLHHPNFSFSGSGCAWSASQDHVQVADPGRLECTPKWAHLRHTCVGGAQFQPQEYIHSLVEGSCDRQVNELFSNIAAGIMWTINGILVIVYYAADHVQAIALAVAAILFAAYTPKEQRVWAVGSGGLAILASLLAPAPVPLFLLIMSLAGWAGRWLEQYNKPAQHWNTIRGQALYALAGLGFALYRNFELGSSIASDPMMSQGAGYLNALIGISMYVIPLGWLAMLTQSIWAHPPAQGTPGGMITTIRTRGKQ